MKIKFTLAFLIACFITPFAIAEDSPDGSGYYVGLNLGYADRHLTQNTFFQNNPNSKTTTGFTGRISAGYSFGPYFALESGFTLLPNAKASFANQEVKSTSFLVDFLLRTSIQFKEHFSVYGKLGMAYVNTKLSVTNQSTSSAAEFRPVFALGTAYAINKAISLNLEWYRMLGNTNGLNGYALRQQGLLGASYAKVPNVDIFTVGIIYLF
jgi:opacity protein-like surface antigen